MENQILQKDYQLNDFFENRKNYGISSALKEDGYQTWRHIKHGFRESEDWVLTIATGIFLTGTALMISSLYHSVIGIGKINSFYNESKKQRKESRLAQI